MESTSVCALTPDLGPEFTGAPPHRCGRLSLVDSYRTCASSGSEPFLRVSIAAFPPRGGALPQGSCYHLRPPPCGAPRHSHCFLSFYLFSKLGELFSIRVSITFQMVSVMENNCKQNLRCPH